MDCVSLGDDVGEAEESFFMPFIDNTFTFGAEETNFSEDDSSQVLGFVVSDDLCPLARILLFDGVDELDNIFAVWSFVNKVSAVDDCNFLG